MVIRVAVPHQFKLKVVPDLRTLFFPDKRDVHYIGGSDILPECKVKMLFFFCPSKKE